MRVCQYLLLTGASMTWWMRSSLTKACSKNVPSLSSATRLLRSFVDMLADWT